MAKLTQNQIVRNSQRQSLNELSGLPGFAGAFDYRAATDDCPELFGNLTSLANLGPLTRDLVQSADFFVQLGDLVDKAIVNDFRDPETGEFLMPPDEVYALATMHDVPVKVVRRRNPEFQPHLLSEDMDEDAREASEDALDHAESLDMMPPKETFDLVVDEKAEYSADFFPYPRDKRLRGYSKNLEKAIERGMNKRSLFLGIQEARKRKVITGSQTRRLWELWKINAFIAGKKNK